MKRLKIKTLFAICAICIFSTLISAKTFASRRVIAISPTNEQIVLIPGETFRGGFKVANPHDVESDLHYLVSLAPFNEIKGVDSRDDYGDLDLETKTNWNQIVDWTTIVNDSGTVKPNGEETIEFTIKVPEDAPAGGQYMALLVKENPEYADQGEGTVGVKEAMQMAFVVFAEVAGETREEGAILENNMPSFLLSNSLEAESMVKNNGNVHTNASYVLQVWPMFSDEEICTNEEDPSTSFVMPETERYHKETCELPSVGIFRVKQTVKIFGETSVVEKVVIVCPIWLLFIIIFAIFALIFYFVAKAKARKKAAKSKSNQN